MKMEETECSETSAYKVQKPGNYPGESVQHSEQGESLKSRKIRNELRQENLKWKTPDRRERADWTILNFNVKVIWTGVMCSRLGAIGRMLSDGAVGEFGAV
jgi:hypothetical protein